MDVLTKLYCSAFKEAAKQVIRHHYHLNICFKNSLLLTIYAINEQNTTCSAYDCLYCEYKNLLPYLPDPVLCASRGEVLNCDDYAVVRTTVTPSTCNPPIISRL